MTNFALPSHVSKRWVVSVESSTGEELSPADFEFFGAATAPGAGAVAMRSTPGESQTVLTLSPLGQAGTWHYSIFCRQKVTAVTWQVASGQISVTPSPCLAQPSFDPDPLLLTAMLDPKTLQVTVSLGDSVAATAEAAQQAAQSAAAAQTSQAAAAQSAAAAKDSQTAAAQAAAEAQTRQTAAAQAAAEALAAQGAAQTAAADAKDSQSAAAQSAADAESAAALLGDAALKSGDNVFTGQNVFNGISNLLPADFWRYDCCTTLEDVRELAGEDETFANWNYPLKNLNISRGGSPFAFSNTLRGKRIYLYCEQEAASFWGDYVRRWNGDELVVFFPNMSGPAYAGFRDCNIKKATIILPKITYLGQYFFYFTGISDLCLVTGTTKTNVSDFWSGGGGESKVKVLRLPNNKLQSFRWENSSGMVTVTSGFPYATLVNIQKAILDKASVLRIVNSLKPYDAATMTEVPTLTLGIDPALEGDEEINAALLNAQESVENGGKGWNVAVSGFTISAAAGVSTMGLRRLVYVKRERDAAGGYIDADGVRWYVRWGNTVIENWQANEELGFEAWPSVEAALEEWGLTEWRPEGMEE